MTTTVKNIIPAKLLENSQTTQYTAATLNTIIDKFTATNTGAAVATISIHLVPSGGTADSSNQIIKDQMVVANETFTALEIMGEYLPIGSFISTICNVATVNIMASGREIS